RQAAQVHLLDAALAQPAGQAGGRAAAVRTDVLAEGAVGIHLRAGALAEDQVGQAPVDTRIEGGTRRALHAVVGPQHLRMAVQFDGLERLAPGVAGGEGGVAARTPVLGGDHGAVGARGEQVGDAGHDRVALVAGERAAGHEVGLEVDQQQGGGGGVGRGHRGGVRALGRGGGGGAGVGGGVWGGGGGAGGGWGGGGSEVWGGGGVRPLDGGGGGVI